MAPIPRRRSDEMTSASPMRVQKPFGVASTSSGVAPSSPAGQDPGEPAGGGRLGRHVEAGRRPAGDLAEEQAPSDSDDVIV